MVWNIFKVKVIFIVNFEQISHVVLVFFVNFEQIHTDWERFLFYIYVACDIME